MLTQRLQQKRILSIDLLRGLVMIIMALDHTRDFFHVHAFTQDPLNPATTNTALFFTRWITHFCAPTFVLLSGASVYLQSLRKSKKELSLFLIKRGVWFILFEIIVFNFAFSFDIHYSTIGLQVIWAIGISMILLAFMIRFPFGVIFIAGLLIVLFHNLLDLYEAGNQQIPVWYSFFHQPRLIPITKEHNLFVMYPFLPWFGLMMMGYCFGKLISGLDAARRKALLIKIGSGLILFFIVLRATNWYGNPVLWTSQKDLLDTAFSFLGTQKYPPSLLYMCMTIGPAILFMAFFENAKGWWAKIISVYGRVPFFYYILHFYLIHLLCMLLFLIRGHSFADGISNAVLVPYFIIPGEGYSLPVVYIIWAFIVVSLFPLCNWYDQYKSNHKDKAWLGYL